MQITIAADHRGFKLKEDLKIYLEAKGYNVDDVGAHTYDPEDDYPDFARAAAHNVARNPEQRGILICGSGMGMDVAANKVRGVRATVAGTAEAATHAASRDGVNVITLSADTLDEDEARHIVDTFLTTSFSGLPRDIRRVEKIRAIEKENS